MKLVLFTHAGGAPTAGVLVGDSVRPLSGYTGPQALVELIDHGLDDISVAESAAIPVRDVTLLPPIPRPGKIVCSTATYGGSGEKAPLLLTLKSAESVIGQGQTVRLPSVGAEWKFVPEAELGLVIRGPAKDVKAADWRSAVFGYTIVIDVMAQGDTQFGRDFWLAKSDTLGPLGPCIVTDDELNPEDLRVSSTVNGAPAQNYAVANADYGIGEQLELATTIMTLHTGDILSCGTSREGLRPLSNGDDVQVEISGVGQLRVGVTA